MWNSIAHSYAIQILYKYVVGYRHQNKRDLLDFIYAKSQELCHLVGGFLFVMLFLNAVCVCVCERCACACLYVDIKRILRRYFCIIFFHRFNQSVPLDVYRLLSGLPSGCYYTFYVSSIYQAIFFNTLATNLSHAKIYLYILCMIVVAQIWLLVRLVHVLPLNLSECTTVKRFD